MKIGFYNPYLDCFGGGERYVLTLASHWSKYNDVVVFWDDPHILLESERRFQLDLRHVKLTSNVFESGNKLLKLTTTSLYDVMFFLSDGSIPFSLAGHTIYHFQVPFPTIRFPVWKRMKSYSIVCNSQFTLDHIDQTVRKNARVIYPPVAVDEFTTGKKEKIILTVGRFDSYWFAKKQDILINIFKEGFSKGILKGWKFILAGSMLSTDQAYVDKLKDSGKGFPIEFFTDLSFSHLRTLYEKAALYWHAAGFGESDPQKMEHFGITTVEAMASGCIPVSYNAGGQPEIINHGEDGYLWTTKEECLDYTVRIIQSEKLQKALRTSAQSRVKLFSSAIFCQRFDEIITAITGR